MADANICRAKVLLEIPIGYFSFGYMLIDCTDCFPLIILYLFNPYSPSLSPNRKDDHYSLIMTLFIIPIYSSLLLLYDTIYNVTVLYLLL